MDLIVVGVQSPAVKPVVEKLWVVWSAIAVVEIEAVIAKFVVVVVVEVELVIAAVELLVPKLVNLELVVLELVARILVAVTAAAVPEPRSSMLSMPAPRGNRYLLPPL